MKLIFALALVAAGLVAMLYFKPGKEAPSQHAISSLTADSVTKIEITQPENKLVVLERRDGKWHTTSPIEARADVAQVENVLALTSATSAVRYPPTDLARFDLDRPLIQIRLNDQEFSFGAVNPLSGEQYVASGSHVYLVSPRFASAAQSESWVSRKLLAEDEDPVRFEFPAFTAGETGDQWSLGSEESSLSQEDFNLWLNRWRLANALSVAPAIAESGTQLKITLANGRVIPLLAVEKKDEFLLVRRDEKLQYAFSPSVGKPLIELPQAAKPK
ncbi:MAG: DUF4340 domain-containing protein [Burkholderiales bacterium]